MEELKPKLYHYHFMIFSRQDVQTSLAAIYIGNSRLQFQHLNTTSNYLYLYH